MRSRRSWCSTHAKSLDFTLAHLLSYPACLCPRSWSPWAHTKWVFKLIQLVRPGVTIRVYYEYVVYGYVAGNFRRLTTEMNCFLSPLEEVMNTIEGAGLSAKVYFDWRGNYQFQVK